MEDTKLPRISVLMAIYNCQETLSEALDSLLGQTFNRFKIILCDDCSTDNTYAIAKSYKDKYPDKFILLKNNINLKLPSTLNRCLEYADTEFIARMDGDDISKPDRFMKQIKFLDENPEYALVSSAMEYFDETGVFRIGKPIERPDNKSFRKNTPYCHAPVMIRTDILRKVGGYTVKSWTERGQDVHLWAKIHSTGNRGFNIKEPLYAMRDDKNAFRRRSLKQALLAFKRRYIILKILRQPRIFALYEFKGILVAISPKWLYDKFHKV